MITSCLERVRHTLLEQNATICDKKVGTLEAQERELVRIRKGLAHASHLIKDSSRSHYTPDQQMSTKDVIATRVDELLKEFQGKDLDPQEDDRILTQVDQEATITMVISLCQVSEGAHPASSTFDSTLPPRIYTGKEYNMKITARNGKGKAFVHGGERVKVSIDPNGACQCTDNHDGTYTVHYTPQSACQNKLHVMIAGQPIKDSPLKVTVKQSRPYTTLTNQNYFNTSYSYPYDVAITDDGHFAVAEYSSHMVSFYDKNTKSYMFSFGTGTAGSRTNQLSSPQGVAISGDTLYVAEYGYSGIKTFSISQKRHITTIGEGQLCNPCGICLDSEGKVFVADYGNHRIQVFNNDLEDGSLQYSIAGNSAIADSQFQYPWGIALDLDGNLHIAAYGSHCIKVFSPTGSYISTYGSGTISSPAGIAINGEGVITISEYGGSHRLWLYDRDQKTLLNTFTGVFSNGAGIACDDDVFWVVGYSNNCIFRF